MRTVCPVLVLCTALAGGLGSAVAPSPAGAGAWTREPGSLQIITTAGRRGAPYRAGEDSDEVETDFLQFYAEYGLAEGLTVGAKFWTDIAPSDPDVGSAAAGLFVRKRLWHTDTGHVASVQAGALAPIERFLNEEFGESKPFSTVEFALRGLYGRSWWGDWGNAFLSTEAGYQVRLEGRPDEIRADVTAGIQPVDCCLAMLGVYGLYPVKEELTESSIRLAPSLGWQVRGPDEESPDRQPTTLQAGLTYDLLEPGDGIGFFLGLWQEIQF